MKRIRIMMKDFNKSQKKNYNPKKKGKFNQLRS